MKKSVKGKTTKLAKCVCPYCEVEITPKEAAVCQVCNVELLRCPACLTIVAKDAATCPHCGRRLACEKRRS